MKPSSERESSTDKFRVGASRESQFIVRGSNSIVVLSFLLQRVVPDSKMGREPLLVRWHVIFILIEIPSHQLREKNGSNQTYVTSFRQHHYGSKTVILVGEKNVRMMGAEIGFPIPVSQLCHKQQIEYISTRQNATRWRHGKIGAVATIQNVKVYFPQLIRKAFQDRFRDYHE